MYMLQIKFHLPYSSNHIPIWKPQLLEPNTVIIIGNRFLMVGPNPT